MIYPTHIIMNMVVEAGLLLLSLYYIPQPLGPYIVNQDVICEMIYYLQ